MSDEKPNGETNENEKLLNLMRFWLFGTFIIVFAAITIYLGSVAGSIAGRQTVNPLLALRAGWPIWVVTGVLCVATYYGYKWYLGRKA